MASSELLKDKNISSTEDIKKLPKRDMVSILRDYREDLEDDALISLIKEFIEADI